MRVQVCAARGVSPVDWAAVSARVLEPAMRKPLRVRFALTCLDLSFNVDTLVSVRCAALHEDRFML